VALNTRVLELPRDDDLIQELCNIEASPTAAGFTRIAAAGRGRDDRAMVTAAVVDMLSGSNNDGDWLRQFADGGLWSAHGVNSFDDLGPEYDD
jgi:hypothetical protein